MTLLERIRAKSLAARKAHSPIASFLVTLLSEASLPGKNANRESTDAETQSVIEKFMKNAKANLKLGVFGAGNEITTLEEFIPQQLTEDELRALVTELTDTYDGNIGAIMSHLKEEYSGHYDGKTAASIIKEVLTLTNA